MVGTASPVIPEMRTLRAALLNPLGGKLHLRAGLQGEPEAVPVPAGGLCGALQPQIFAQLAGAAALELGDGAVLGHAPRGQLRLILAVRREEEVLVLPCAARKQRIPRRILNGQAV